MAPQDDEALGGDETQRRLLDWREGQTPSEYLAALILDAEGYGDIDPSHPLGGPDDGRDGHCTKNGESWTWAVYFPRGQHDLRVIETKLTADIEAARKHNPKGIVFVTNQELRLSERDKLRTLGGDLPVEIIHLYRVATILDRPPMARVRQQYLKIAAGRPPIQVKASVSGAARVFINDVELLDRFVHIREKEIREESDQAWAKVHAEQEEARLRADAARARAQELADRDLDRKSPQQIAGTTIRDIFPQFNLQDILPKVEPPKFDLGLSQPPLLADIYAHTQEPSPSPNPLSEDEIQAKVTTYREKLESNWAGSTDYLASVAWPGLKFCVQNGEGFLTNLQVVLTFHGAVGLDHEYLDSFEWQRMEDPNWTEPFNPFLGISAPPPPLSPRDLKDYPVRWEHNDFGDLVVKLTLAELRPQEVWNSDADDIVLMLRDLSLDSVAVTYTITAYEHHDRVDGEPFTVPVQEVDIFDSVRAAHQAIKRSE